MVEGVEKILWGYSKLDLTLFYISNHHRAVVPIPVVGRVACPAFSIFVLHLRIHWWKLRSPTNNRNAESKEFEVGPDRIPQIDMWFVRRFYSGEASRKGAMGSFYSSNQYCVGFVPRVGFVLFQ